MLKERAIAGMNLFHLQRNELLVMGMVKTGPSRKHPKSDKLFTKIDLLTNILALLGGFGGDL